MDIYAHAADVVRSRDRDRYVADLFAPDPARKHLLALHAFSAEVARVREVVREPALGEIRLQWWRDAVAAREGAGHPVAEAVIATIKDYALPAVAFDMLIEARIFDLYDDPMPTMNDLEGYAGETASSLIQLGALVLGGGRDAGAADAAGHAGVAETMVAVLRRIARDPANGAKYVPDGLLDKHAVRRDEIAGRQTRPEVVALFAELRALARDHLAQATAALAALGPEVAPAFLPLALSAAILERMERNSAQPYANVDLAPWRRQWIIWRAARQWARGR